MQHIDNISYERWSDQSLIADCLRDLGMNELALKVISNSESVEIIDKYLSIIEKVAKKRKHSDVLERLYFAGLIYSKGEL